MRSSKNQSTAATGGNDGSSTSARVHENALFDDGGSGGGGSAADNNDDDDDAPVVRRAATTTTTTPTPLLQAARIAALEQELTRLSEALADAEMHAGQARNEARIAQARLSEVQQQRHGYGEQQQHNHNTLSKPPADATTTNSSSSSSAHEQQQEQQTSAAMQAYDQVAKELNARLSAAMEAERHVRQTLSEAEARAARAEAALQLEQEGAEMLSCALEEARQELSELKSKMSVIPEVEEEESGERGQQSSAYSIAGVITATQEKSISEEESVPEMSSMECSMGGVAEAVLQENAQLSQKIEELSRALEEAHEKLKESSTTTIEQHQEQARHVREEQEKNQGQEQWLFESANLLPLQRQKELEDPLSSSSSLASIRGSSLSDDDDNGDAMDNDLLDLPAELQVPEEEEDAEEDAERLESAALHSATSIMRMAEEAELSLEGVEQEAATLRAKQEEMEFQISELTCDLAAEREARRAAEADANKAGAALHSATSITLLRQAELSLESVEQEAATLRGKQEGMEFQISELTCELAAEREARHAAEADAKKAVEDEMEDLRGVWAGAQDDMVRLRHEADEQLERVQSECDAKMHTFVAEENAKLRATEAALASAEARVSELALELQESNRSAHREAETAERKAVEAEMEALSSVWSGAESELEHDRSKHEEEMARLSATIVEESTRRHVAEEARLGAEAHAASLERALVAEQKARHEAEVVVEASQRALEAVRLQQQEPKRGGGLLRRR